MFFFEVWRPYVFIIPNYRQPVLLHYTAIDLLAWSREGCKTLPGENSGTVRCECTHLTNFALLLDDNQSKTITTLSSLNQVGKLMLSSCLVRFKRRNPVEKKKNWTCIKHFEDFQKVFWMSYVSVIYIMCQGENWLK